MSVLHCLDEQIEFDWIGDLHEGNEASSRGAQFPGHSTAQRLLVLGQPAERARCHQQAMVSHDPISSLTLPGNTTE